MTPLLCLTLLACQPASAPTCCQPALLVQLPACQGRRAAKVPYAPQPGDILLFRSYSVLSNVACAAVLCGSSHHCAIVVARNDGSLGLLHTPKVGSCVEMSEIAPVAQSYHGRVYVRRRCAPMTPQQCANLTTFAHTQEGKPYDYAGVTVMPFCRPALAVSKSAPSAEDVDPPHWFCSSLVVGACLAANLLDGCEVRPTCVCPNDLMNDRLVDLSRGWEKPAALTAEKCGAGR